MIIKKVMILKMKNVKIIIMNVIVIHAMKIAKNVKNGKENTIHIKSLLMSQKILIISLMVL